MSLLKALTFNTTECLKSQRNIIPLNRERFFLLSHIAKTVKLLKTRVTF